MSELSRRVTGPGPMPKVVLVALAIYAAYLPLALWLGHHYVPDRRPVGKFVERISGITHLGGYAFRAPSRDPLFRYADDDLANQQSPIVIYEDITPLGPGRSTVADIQRSGAGRFSHASNPLNTEWRSYKEYIFSATDNSDPRTNGRRYWAVLPFPPQH